MLLARISSFLGNGRRDVLIFELANGILGSAYRIEGRLDRDVT